MLEKYLHDVIAAPLPDRDEIATFLCTDVVFDKPSAGNPLREGYLTKKGQNLGRWVTRYYVLRGSKLDFFEVVSWLSCAKENFDADHSF
jgi:RalA-binding protein 1